MNRRAKVRLILGCVAVSIASIALGEVDLSKLPPPANKKDVTYEKDIKPIFEASLQPCQAAPADEIDS